MHQPSQTQYSQKGRRLQECSTKHRRRLSDARWRANVTTCYETLKLIIPVNKRASKRQISKLHILNESDKHIQFCEEILSSLLKEKAQKKKIPDIESYKEYKIHRIKQNFAKTFNSKKVSLLNSKDEINSFEDFQEEAHERANEDINDDDDEDETYVPSSRRKQHKKISGHKQKLHQQIKNSDHMNVETSTSEVSKSESGNMHRLGIAGATDSVPQPLMIINDKEEVQKATTVPLTMLQTVTSNSKTYSVKVYTPTSPSGRTLTMDVYHGVNFAYPRGQKAVLPKIKDEMLKEKNEEKKLYNICREETTAGTIVGVPKGNTKFYTIHPKKNLDCNSINNKYVKEILNQNNDKLNAAKLRCDEQLDFSRETDEQLVPEYNFKKKTENLSSKAEAKEIEIYGGRLVQYNCNPEVEADGRKSEEPQTKKTDKSKRCNLDHITNSSMEEIRSTGEENRLIMPSEEIFYKSQSHSVVTTPSKRKRSEESTPVKTFETTDDKSPSCRGFTPVKLPQKGTTPTHIRLTPVKPRQRASSESSPGLTPVKKSRLRSISYSRDGTCLKPCSLLRTPDKALRYAMMSRPALTPPSDLAVTPPKADFKLSKPALTPPSSPLSRSSPALRLRKPALTPPGSEYVLVPKYPKLAVKSQMIKSRNSRTTVVHHYARPVTTSFKTSAEISERRCTETQRNKHTDSLRQPVSLLNLESTKGSKVVTTPTKPPTSSSTPHKEQSSLVEISPNTLHKIGDIKYLERALIESDVEDEEELLCKEDMWLSDEFGSESEDSVFVECQGTPSQRAKQGISELRNLKKARLERSFRDRFESSSSQTSSESKDRPWQTTPSRKTVSGDVEKRKSILANSRCRRSLESLYDIPATQSTNQQSGSTDCSESSEISNSSSLYISKDGALQHRTSHEEAGTEIEKSINEVKALDLSNLQHNADCDVNMNKCERAAGCDERKHTDKCDYVISSKKQNQDHNVNQITKGTSLPLHLKNDISADNFNEELDFEGYMFFYKKMGETFGEKLHECDKAADLSKLILNTWKELPTTQKLSVRRLALSQGGVQRLPVPVKSPRLKSATKPWRVTSDLPDLLQDLDNEVWPIHDVDKEQTLEPQLDVKSSMCMVSNEGDAKKENFDNMPAAVVPQYEPNNMDPFLSSVADVIDVEADLEKQQWTQGDFTSVEEMKKYLGEFSPPSKNNLVVL